MIKVESTGLCRGWPTLGGPEAIDQGKLVGSTVRYDILGKDAATATWYQIRFSGSVTGWVSADYVQTHAATSPACPWPGSPARS